MHKTIKTWRKFIIAALCVLLTAFSEPLGLTAAARDALLQFALIYFGVQGGVDITHEIVEFAALVKAGGNGGDAKEKT